MSGATPVPAPSGSTLLELLRGRVADQPDRTAFTFLDHAGEEAAELSFEGLDRRAREIAATLQRVGLAGERALMIFPPGPEFTTALYGCIYAGALAVPCPPPDPGRKYAGPRIRALVGDATPRAILSPAALQPAIGEVLAEGGQTGARPRLVATDAELDAADGWIQPATEPADIALFQYTSGSTAVPRGVMVSHANILDNCEYIGDGFEWEGGSRGVMWLPPYHDMGLIGGMFSPVHSGRAIVLMPPTAFLLDPTSWLRAISRYRATTSGGPDFAFDLCVRRSSPEQRAGLDLSSWETAYNGAEPVRRETMDAFTEAFSPHGFRGLAFYPCYGLAEATLMVSGGDKLAPPKMLEADRGVLEHGRFVAAGGSDAVSLISCGQPRAGARVEIVDPDSRQPCPEDAIGEIWISGSSVAAGYWGRAVETEFTFGARTAVGEGPFLRSGDLGFLRDGELYVTGRIAEVLVVDERLLYPADIELAAEASSPGLRHNCAAAFLIDTGGRQRLALVAEVREGEDLDAVYEGVRSGVAERLDLSIGVICLISPRTIPRTSSGKTRRGLCRELYLKGRLEAVGEWLDTS